MPITNRDLPVLRDFKRPWAPSVFPRSKDALINSTGLLLHWLCLGSDP
jgi:hypothetical protein